MMIPFGSDEPNRDDLEAMYKKLKENHPHDLLPLETCLPDELKWKSREQYRVIMTMILAQATTDKHLTECLKLLFNRYPDIASMRHLQKQDIKPLLGRKKAGGIGLGFGDPCRSGNGGRLWSFQQSYFGAWGQTLTEANILTLIKSRGFTQGHFVRLLQSYCFGNKDVIPLDGPALSALRDPLFPAYLNFSDEEIRKDIEDKLKGKAGVSLIDFHEMLRFLEQYIGKSKKTQENIIVGWNAWRLLCSSKRDEINEKWIRRYLVKDDALANKIWVFFQSIVG